MHYNPADDPKVINGIQEAYGFKIGDVVEYTNPYGLVFSPYVVVGFVQNPDPDFLPENVVYINSESPWYPVKASALKKCNKKADDKRICRLPTATLRLTRKGTSQTKNLHLVGFDCWSRPVYQEEESGQLWKDINLGQGKPFLHNSVDNDFEGEPDMPISNDYTITKLRRKTHA